MTQPEELNLNSPMKFRKWSNMVVEAAGNPEAFQQAREHLADFRDYLHRLIDEKRGHPSTCA